MNKICPDLSAVITYNQRDDVSVQDVLHNHIFQFQLNHAKSYLKKDALKILHFHKKFLPRPLSESDMFVVMLAETAEDLESMIELSHVLRLKRESESERKPVNFIIVHPMNLSAFPSSYWLDKNMVA